MNKKDLSERDICSRFIGPAVKRAGWDGMMQIREEVNFTRGRITVRGKLVTCGKAKRADYILYYKLNIPIAIIEAKDNNHGAWKGLTPDEEAIVLQDYFEDGSGKEPRYHQRNSINATIEAIAKGQNRILLVMATGTGKTYTAFQIIWRLWKAGRKKRILFLADRNVLVDQTMVNDFRPFGAAMAKLSTGSKTIERVDTAEAELTDQASKGGGDSCAWVP